MISRTGRFSLDPRQRVAWHSAARQKTRHSKQPHVQLSILHLWTWCEYDMVADLGERTLLIFGSTCGRRHRSLLSTCTHHFKSSSVIPTKCYQSSNAFVSDFVSHASVISTSVKDKTATGHFGNGHQFFHILHPSDLGAQGVKSLSSNRSSSDGVKNRFHLVTATYLSLCQTEARTRIQFLHHCCVVHDSEAFVETDEERPIAQLAKICSEEIFFEPQRNTCDAIFLENGRKQHRNCHKKNKQRLCLSCRTKRQAQYKNVKWKLVSSPDLEVLRMSTLQRHASNFSLCTDR